MAGRVCYVLFGLAAGARPHDSIDEELGTDASFSNVILPDFLRNLAVKESALDTALLQTPSGSEEICNAAAGAVKAVQAGTVRFADEFSSSCDFLSIKDEDCFSTSPLWTCKFSESGPNCHCRWTPTCHGVMKALPVSAGTHIVCLPMGNGCHCWGSLNCTSQLDYWTCAAFDHNSKEEKDLWVQRSLQAQLSPGKPAEKQTEADKKLGQGLDGLKKQALDMLHAGGCKCSAEARLVLSIPLSSAELSALSEESLAEFHVESQETATGQSVKNAVRETDSSGNDRVVLTITDKNQTGGSSTVPNKGVKTAKLDDKPTESESCVITGGQVKLDAWEKAAIFIMASPSILAVVLMVAINCFRVCFNSVSRRRSTENAVPAAEKPPLFFMVFCLFIEFISLLNVTSVLTTSHVAAAMFKDLEEQLGLPLSSLLLAAAPVGGSLGTVWTASFLMNRPSLVCTGTCLLIGVCNLIYALGLQVQSFSLLLATRFLGGFAGGATYFISVYFTRLSSRNSRTRIFGWYNFGMAAGLISGPVLASLLSTQEVERQLELFTSHNFEVGEACAYVVALISLSGAVLGSLYLPPNGEGLGVAELELELALRPVWWADDSMSAEFDPPCPRACEVDCSCVLLPDCWCSDALSASLGSSCRHGAGIPLLPGACTCWLGCICWSPCLCRAAGSSNSSYMGERSQSRAMFPDCGNSGCALDSSHPTGR